MNCSNHYTLLFKMHGNRSNLALFEGGKLIEIFKSSISEDTKLSLEMLDREIDWSYEHFTQHYQNPQSIYFTFGKSVWKYFKLNQFDRLSPEQQWKEIQNVRENLENPDGFYIQQLDGKIMFSLLDFGRVIKRFKEPVAAVTDFYTYYIQHDAFEREKASALALLRSMLHSNENYMAKTETKLHELQDENSYKVWADLLMANLHDIPAGSTHVTLPNFYQDNRPTQIKLKPDVSAQKNAAIFYKKAKNQQLEIDHLQKLIKNKKQQTLDLANLLRQIEEENDLNDLRKLIGSMGTGEVKKQVAALPYREVEFNGYKIWIGRNAAANDSLTLKFSYKEDMWLHAKDVAGSHVLLKHQAGKNFPKDVVERAAQLAAYYSKRKNESLCPVIVTPRKFVRKRKGDPAGVVVVEREEVVMVTPMAPERLSDR
jgi:predicted ribosome quality control (RQC) complex YloA/Tae2 family protein